jgi:predicted CXXCH cytochrome family protein
MKNDEARCIRLGAAVACPAVSVALIVSVALLLTPFGPSQGSALAALPAPTETATSTVTAIPTVTATPTTTPPPTSTPTLSSLASSPSSTLIPVTTPVPTPVPSLPLTAAGIPADHHILARIGGADFKATYLRVDAPVLDAVQFQTFRVRFRMHNAATAPITPTPRLEYRTDGAAGFVVVPEKPKLGIPFHVAREWVPSLGHGGGTMQGPLGENIAVEQLRIGKESGLAVSGHHSMGANPDRPITLPPASYTDEEFTVTLSIDAKFLTGYELRITNGGTALTGTDVAKITLGAPPAVRLSPGQRQGVAVAGPKKTSAAVAYPLLSAALKVAGTTSAAVVPGVYSPSAALYPLAASTSAVAGSVIVKISDAGIKGSHSDLSDQCSVCHGAHTAQGPKLLKSASQSTLCFTCHNGTQANGAVQAEYTDPTLPGNNANALDYYSHATTSTPSTIPADSELKFRDVTNRNIECADCHNSHKVNNTASEESSDQTGWTASGRLAGVSGVSVENSTTPGAAPTYKFLDGVTDPVTREYQLCFKCHSGFTTLLPPKIPARPSTDQLDKGIEFNPYNASFHPVEAKGTNQTPKMQASLDGSSPYKLWNFRTTGTVRCLNCHASGTTLGPTGTSDPTATPGPTPDPTATPPPAGSDLAPHTSSNRGILLRPYQDRVLKPAGDAYSAGDFGLCYVCHAEAPFAPGGTSSDATNFPMHSEHLTGLIDKGGTGTDIDKAGDGQGNAICAECHFRIHSTTNTVSNQVGGARLVNFAPNVEPNGLASPSWTSTGIGAGSCTLTCHGYTHDGFKYQP